MRFTTHMMDVEQPPSRGSEIPSPGAAVARAAVRAMVRHRSVFAGLETLHHGLGDIFRLPLPNFSPIMLVGPEPARLIHVDQKDAFQWRVEGDPVTRLLRHGLLVEDGETHARLRGQIDPSLHKRQIGAHIETMQRVSHQIQAGWDRNGLIDAFSEMRRMTLMILCAALFGEDLTDRIGRLWRPVVGATRFISPGLWMLWPAAAGMRRSTARKQLDAFLVDLIGRRREQRSRQDDLVSRLIQAGMHDDLIRDQLLTLLIAGHDTNTALTSWALYLLGKHPVVQAEVQAELDGLAPEEIARGSSRSLEAVIQETLRLYPPIHLSSRVTRRELSFGGYRIPAGARVMHSIYLTHRHPRYWPDPGAFDPGRFNSENTRRRQAHIFLPFGAGTRNCIGFSFAMVEARVILGSILQRFWLTFDGPDPRPSMGATLHPRGQVWLKLRKRPHARSVRWVT